MWMWTWIVDGYWVSPGGGKGDVSIKLGPTRNCSHSLKFEERSGGKEGGPNPNPNPNPNPIEINNNSHTSV